MLRRLTLSLAAGVGVAGFCVSGCTHTITLQERTASFAPYETAQIGTQPVRSFLIENTAVLVAGAQAVLHRDADGRPAGVELDLKDRSRLGFGSATAIDPRGYLLTAGHCVTKEPVHLFFGDSGKTGRIEPARVVWRGNAENGQPDLALLRIPHRLASALVWAADYKRGDPALAAGLNYDSSYNLQPGCIAGTVTKIDRHAADSPPHDHIYHQAPMHGGDSGGPLTTTDGRLIGINTGSGSLRVWPFVWLVSRAERPDLTWLRQIIEEDFAQPHPAAP